MTMKVTDYPDHRKYGYKSQCDILIQEAFNGTGSILFNNGTDEDEPIVCSHFGCNKHLTLMEQLFGNKCVEHNGEKVKQHLFKQK